MNNDHPVDHNVHTRSGDIIASAHTMSPNANVLTLRRDGAITQR